MKHPNEQYMKKCISLAIEAGRCGNYPLSAAVVTPDGQILAAKGSQLIHTHDPTAHPEILCIRHAANNLKERVLHGCYLYSTVEPCPMCTAAAIWACMEGIVFGATQGDAVAYAEKHPAKMFTWRQIRIPCQYVAYHGTPKLIVHGKVLRDECIRLFRNTPPGDTLNPQENR